MTIGIDSGKTLQEQVLGVRKKWSWFGVKKKLRKEESAAIADLLDAKEERLSHSQKIINTRNPFYSVLTKLKSQFESYYHESTFPWVEDGVRLLRKDKIAEFNEEVEKVQSKIKKGVQTLGENWDDIKKESKHDLGTAYNEKHFDVQLAEEFDLELSWVNLTPPDHLKTIDPKLYEQEKARIAAAFDKAVTLTIDAYSEGLYNLVVKMTDKLRPDKDGKQSQFKSNYFDGFKDFIDNFRKMNVTSSADLEKLINDAESLVCNVNVKALKDQQTREGITKQFEDLGLLIETKLVPKQRRKLLLGSPELKIAEQSQQPQEEVA